MISFSLTARLGLATATAASLWAVIANLPRAPVLPGAQSTPPTTTSGSLARSMEKLSAAGATLWATIPAPPYWEILRQARPGGPWLNVTPEGESTRGGLITSALGPKSAAVAYRAYGGNKRSGFAITSDGGSTWKTGLLPGAVVTSNRPMAAPSLNSIWAVVHPARSGSGQSSVLEHSTDAGQSWRAIPLATSGPGSCAVKSVRFVSATAGWVGGSCAGRPALWSTTNGGRSWSAEPLTAPAHSVAVASAAVPDGAPGSQPLWSWAKVASHGRTVVAPLKDTGGHWHGYASLTVAGRIRVTRSGSGEIWVLAEGQGTKAPPRLFVLDSSGRWVKKSSPPGGLVGITALAGGGVGILGHSDKRSFLWVPKPKGLPGWLPSEIKPTTAP